ncbi:archaemetzincin [Chondrinema litorale]|uniref:archaemetzincin n=1 Tax=Chondrinema litorale TaxID=2994555 RepID=UPI002542A799|nr:archaemetzincin [Chondrinema litorale]UZR99540.1 archaemetzincin [Chondrinema litorale]
MCNYKALQSASLIKPILFTITLLAIFSCETKQENANTSKQVSIEKEFQLADLKLLKPLQLRFAEPNPGEWAYIHHEGGQSFSAYKNSNPVRPSSKRNKIYIKPIGKFTKSDSLIFESLKTYTQVFFGLETILLAQVSDSIIPNVGRRQHDDIEQLHTKYILNEILIKSLPADAIMYTAVTSKDLYPKAGWNYVFGQSNLEEKVGVLSMYRYKVELSKNQNQSLFLNRLLKTATHEMGHILSIKHCTRYKCLMNGSNSLPEADAKPSWLCSECLAKLIWCTNGNIRERYNALITFSNKHAFPKKAKFYTKSMALLSVE